MYKQAIAALSLSFGLGLAFSSASCGPTCPHGQQSCGDSNGSAAGSGATDPANCDVLTAMRSCMGTFCKTASNPFCDCYNKNVINKGSNYLNGNTCECAAFDAKKFCDLAEQNGVDASAYDCAAESSGVSSYCVPVQ